MAEFVLCNNYFEFSEVFQQISRTTISRKFAPPYTCIYMQTWMEKVSIALAHAILKTVMRYIARLKHCLMFHSFSVDFPPVHLMNESEKRGIKSQHS